MPNDKACDYTYDSENRCNRPANYSGRCEQHRKCYGCEAVVPDEPGVYYCDDCVVKQMADQGDERAAFDAYHRWVDAQTKGG